MALKSLPVHPCAVCCCGRWLGSGSFAERGYLNALSGKMRFRFAIPFLRAAKLSTRSKHKIAGKVDKNGTQIIPDRSKLLKMQALMDYDGFRDFIGEEKANKIFGGDLRNAAGDFDMSFACKKFPSLRFGSSAPIELYEETTDGSVMESLLASTNDKEFISTGASMKWLDTDDLCEQLSPVQNLPDLNPTESEELRDASIESETNEQLEGEELNHLPLFTEKKNLGNEEISDVVTVDDLSATKRPQVLPNAATLDAPLSCVPGLTTRQCNQLENYGFHTLRKLLHHFPRTYADLRNAQVGVDDGQYLISVGKVLSSRGVRANCSFSFLEVIVGCEITDGSAQVFGDTCGFEKKTIYLHLKKFFRGTRFTFQPFLRRLEENHKVGELVCVSGKVRKMPANDHYEMREYNIDTLKDDEGSSARAEERLYPIYPSKGRLNPEFLRDIIWRAVQVLSADIDPIPRHITQDFGLLPLGYAYLRIHQPKSVEDADSARKRLIFDEFFYLQLGRLFQMLEGLGSRIEKDGLLDKHINPKFDVVPVEQWSNLAKEFSKIVPYALTPSQLTAVSEIIWDLSKPVPMNRLLQGDVGCGKTIVAFLACMEVIGHGYQAAFMVPTELLAIQHYEHLLHLLEFLEEKSRPSVALLCGSTPMKQSRIIRKACLFPWSLFSDLQTGAISMVIGTHTLISENIDFSSLRITVVDEQHRFGVIQRGRFNSKLYTGSSISRIEEANSEEGSSEGDVSMAPHVLALSATPIPRTLALALYGDMSLTQITDLPPGRLPVETCVVEGNDSGFEEVYKMMLDELKSEGRVYLVYPIIQQSEQLPQLKAASADLENISQKFPDYSCGLLHGKMKSDEKEQSLRRFRCGETQILLSTQVIEVGVDVPDASMMVVMNAERFGIAQLHQLRGRVGRGTRKSKCVLVGSTSSSLERLKVLEKSSDGFHLANVDLLIRGPGDLLGKKQSGHLPEFPIARLEKDGNILQDAHTAALRILRESHDLEKFPGLKAELSMRQPLCLLGD
ncbi:ATP-dependent DNA helicase homolog RECG, chloroplastic [Linum grandiflorum]